ncbi:MAG: serine/threonine protein kinase [Myxococcales bacterium]|nr:serine/threonine protein kinase [Myxococcales bacterium]
MDDGAFREDGGRLQDDLVGTTIDGRYTLEEVACDELLGRVYVAKDGERPRRVRLKLMRREYLLSSDEEKFRRFQREIEAHGLVRSDGVLRLVDAGSHEGLTFSVFPGIAQRTLQDLVDEGPMDPVRATDLITKVAVGLAALHREGVIHRDLIAANVLVDDKDEVYIRDLGLASFVSVDDATASLTAADDRVGHASSMAPEYISAQTVHPSADIYALGVLTFQLLTGRPPFDGRGGQVLNHHLSAVPPAPSATVSEIPGWLDALVLSMLEKDPDRRPKPDEVVARIRKGWRDLPPPRTDRQIARSIAALSSALAAACIVAGVVWGVKMGVIVLPELPDPPEVGLSAYASSVRTDVVEEGGEDIRELWMLPSADPMAAPRIYVSRAEVDEVGSAAGTPPSIGLVEIRSNRRALITVDGRPLGYAPLKAWLPSGAHRLTATLPARPDSLREEALVVETNGEKRLELVF